MDVQYRYNQETGDFSRRGANGRWVKVADGYSGYRFHRNNPQSEAIRGFGPIPKGAYLIGPARHSRNVGPVAMYLWPVGHMAHGRSALMIHGDNGHGTASRGCVILPRIVREEIARTVATSDAASPPVALEVV